MGHEHFHGFPGMPHGPSAPHEHVHPFDDADDLSAGDHDAGCHQFESLWIDIGGEG